MRIAIVKKEKCKIDAQCNFLCKSYCPIARTGKKIITRDEVDNKPVIDELLCIGCGICVKRCPFSAIDIINLPQELNVNPIHRYGKNGFQLFNLPVPRFGKVVGILGQNGIGKSSAFKILSSQIMPNLGKATQEEDTIDKIIEFYRGKEEQNYFEALKKNQISVAYKIQEVEKISKIYSDKTVLELLKSADETNSLEKVSNKLNISNILDRKIKQLSGGELQKIAIAATSMKKANVFLFDEPCSYLDIKERLRVSDFIRSLANEDTAVLVVEHDLIILDYISDLVSILYGKPGAYGICAMLKNTKDAINEYLHGFLKEENVRIRDSGITFQRKQNFSKATKSKLITWDDIVINQGNFNLKTDSGTIELPETIGLVGENGIGKTTFIKGLAGVIKLDSGEIDKQIAISYKPQYLNSEDDTFVRVAVSNAIKNHKQELIQPFRIDELFDKQINQLSGGELQRVSIVACLSNEADLYLLDEPSAYLDIEQRVILSKLISDFLHKINKSAIIVDHDLLFIDYISDKLITIIGEKSKFGNLTGPKEVKEAINSFLYELDITMRRDKEAQRPRINKKNSRMDKIQREQDNRYML
jgi:ATP-binding cassette subfamily E protein 1